MPAAVSITRGRGGEGATRQQGQYALLQLASPGRALRNIGVLLLEPASGRCETRLLDHWEDVADAEEIDLLSEIGRDFTSKIEEMGGERFLLSLEDSLSNFLRITGRESVEIEDFENTLDRLFEEHVEEATIVPFATHLPRYTLEAAATKFGHDMEVAEEGWVKAPRRLRLTDKMFVARVVGRSMEPRIPDGSLCIFRANVVLSRQGKIVLVERSSITDKDFRYTVKRYTSKKKESEDGGWEHEWITLEPLNREFESFPLEPGDQIIAEFVQVLE